MMLTNLASILRAAGLTVIEEPGWKQRGHGAMSDIRTITCHHTANGGAKGVEPSRTVVRDGRPGLKGPLAQLLLRKDGVYRVIAAGLCYHAGVSRDNDYTNSHAIGIEAEAEGVDGADGDWPTVQMVAYYRGCAALVDAFDLSVSDVRAHKETCSPVGRKSDPNLNMATFRSRVAAVNLAKPIVEAIVALTETELNRIADRVMDRPNDRLDASLEAATDVAFDRVKVIYGRTDILNRFRTEVRGALAEELADPSSPLSVALKQLNDKLDRVLAGSSTPPGA